MKRLSGPAYLGSERKMAHDARRAAQILGLVGWVLEPVRERLAIALDIPYDHTLFLQPRRTLSGQDILVPKLRTIPLREGEELPKDRIQRNTDTLQTHGTTHPDIPAFCQLVRRLAIDEWPQLEQVQKHPEMAGPMYLVAPRPKLPQDIAAYRRADPRKAREWETMATDLRLLAGIDGPSQIARKRSGQTGAAALIQTMDLDTHWMKTTTAFNDDRILLSTPFHLIAASVYQHMTSDPKMQ
jgi:lipopolysaccharide/colanic/teichoic acid biosynthesis glycosyltransferase